MYSKEQYWVIQLKIFAVYVRKINLGAANKLIVLHLKSVCS